MSKEEKKIYLTNIQVYNIFQWCYGLMLHGEEARMRNRVLKYLTPLVAAYDADRVKILEEHTKKDKDQKPIIVEGKYQFEEGQEAKARESIGKLMEEVVPFTLDKDKKLILRNIASLLKDNFKAPLDAEKGKIYDEILGILEVI